MGGRRVGRYADCLEGVLEEELVARKAADTERRLRAAGFPFPATIEQFDFRFRLDLRDPDNPSVLIVRRGRPDHQGHAAWKGDWCQGPPWRMGRTLAVYGSVEGRAASA